MRIAVALSVLALAASLLACERESPTNGMVTPPKAAAAPAAAQDPEGPNPNAARYGPHGVAETPPEAPGAPTAAAPALDPAETADITGHVCHCGASCKCGHCAGAVPGCHCKAERNAK
jgi:hypothetical protein